jgi:alpha-1,2-mannosyltransferase
VLFTDAIKHVKERFSITIPPSLDISFLHMNKYAFYLDPAPRFSLLVESWNSLWLAWNALQLSMQTPPHIFVDTTGYAFTYPVARFLVGCHVIAYVHYPTISTDMLRLVWDRRRTSYNHAEQIAQSSWRTALKLVYYVWFAVIYGIVGSCASLVWVNSTWTQQHIQSLWLWAARWKQCIHILYPPCPTSKATLSSKTRETIVLSIGQFRPEKDHMLQLESFEKLLEKYPQYRQRKDDKAALQLVLLGSCRGKEDQERLQRLQDWVKEHRLQDSITFCVNKPYATLQDWLSKASVGIHTVCSAYITRVHEAAIH